MGRQGAAPLHTVYYINLGKIIHEVNLKQQVA